MEWESAENDPAINGWMYVILDCGSFSMRNFTSKGWHYPHEDCSTQCSHNNEKILYWMIPEYPNGWTQ